MAVGEGLVNLRLRVQTGRDLTEAIKRLRRAVNAINRASRANRVASKEQITEQREAAEVAYWALHRFADATHQVAERMKEWSYVVSHRL